MFVHYFMLKPIDICPYICYNTSTVKDKEKSKKPERVRKCCTE
nr:MAG TPA: hypothetical protein [Caudoviricetes sp.]